MRENPPSKARSRIGRRWLLVGSVVLGAGLAAVWGAHAWVAGHGAAIYERVDEVPHKPVAIVLGARVHADGTPYPALADRLAAALDLYRAGLVRRILVSGDHGSEGYDEVNGMRAWLLREGVPDSAIFMDHAGLRTLDTMFRAASVFGVTDAVVCTQRYHLPRALFLARAAGIEAVGLVADRRIYPKARLDAAREALARARALLDVYVFGTRPRYLGPPISLDGPSSATWDRNTQRP